MRSVKRLLVLLALLALHACSTNLPTSPESQDVPNLASDSGNSTQQSGDDPPPPPPPPGNGGGWY